MEAWRGSHSLAERSLSGELAMRSAALSAHILTMTIIHAGVLQSACKSPASAGSGTTLTSNRRSPIQTSVTAVRL